MMSRVLDVAKTVRSALDEREQCKEEAIDAMQLYTIMRSGRCRFEEPGTEGACGKLPSAAQT